MTVNSFDIPCAYCGRLPLSDQYDEELLCCPDCEQSITKEEWKEGGIHAMAGKLMREEGSIGYAGGMNWRWSFPQDEHGRYPWGLSSSFEQAVIDAWKYFKREKP